LVFWVPVLTGSAPHSRSETARQLKCLAAVYRWGSRLSAETYTALQQLLEHHIDEEEGEFSRLFGRISSTMT
jgi:hypothetical protein